MKIHRNTCIYGPVCDGGIWSDGRNGQFYNLHGGTLTLTDILITRLECLGHLIRIQNNRNPKVAFIAKLEVKRNVGGQNWRWLENIQADFKIILASNEIFSPSNKILITTLVLLQGLKDEKEKPRTEQTGWMPLGKLK